MPKEQSKSVEFKYPPDAMHMVCPNVPKNRIRLFTEAECFEHDWDFGKLAQTARRETSPDLRGKVTVWVGGRRDGKTGLEARVVDRSA